MTRRGFLRGLLATTALVIAPAIPAFREPSAPGDWVLIVHPGQEAWLRQVAAEPAIYSWGNIRFVTSERAPGRRLP